MRGKETEIIEWVNNMSEEVPEFKRIDFLIKRLDHTISHTHTSTKHIYLVNGAILAAFYFTIGGKFDPSFSFRIAGGLFSLLGIVNFLHAILLFNQHTWYRLIDIEIQYVLNNSNINLRSLDLSQSYNNLRANSAIGFFRLLRSVRSTHSVYILVHIIISIGLFVASALCFIYASDASDYISQAVEKSQIFGIIPLI